MRNMRKLDIIIILVRAGRWGRGGEGQGAGEEQGDYEVPAL